MSIQFFSIKERDSRSFSVSRSENLQLPNQKNLRNWKNFLTITKKIAAKKAAVKKSSNISCPVLKNILSFSPEELNERSRLKRMKKKEKREKVKLRKAEDQSRAEQKKRQKILLLRLLLPPLMERLRQ
jgi:hypothetical protein